MAIESDKLFLLLVLLQGASVLAQIYPEGKQLWPLVDWRAGSLQERVNRIRQSFLYPYLPEHRVSEITDQVSQVTKLLNVPLPFYGFNFNYTWLSLNGYIAFSNAPPRFAPPLRFPSDDWPDVSDPSFIGPFYTRAKMGKTSAQDPLAPGVYFGLYRNIGIKNDPLELGIKEALQADIREGMIGSTLFRPKHVIIVTWKNTSFSGGGVGAASKTNTFQLVMATDEVKTYAFYNYELLTWTSSTEAGGSTEDGLGGISAFVGFNAGNGTAAFEYRPYSQSNKIFNLISDGQVNGKPGRHIFRIDELILQGACNPEPTAASNTRLVISPESGNMLGGQVVNVTGPCFQPDDRVTAQFQTGPAVTCSFQTRNYVSCVTPPIYYAGYVEMSVLVNNNPILFRTNYLVEPPDEVDEMVWFPYREQVRTLDPAEVQIRWSPGNLTQDIAASVSINLYGYRETGSKPEFLFIDTLVPSKANDGFIKLNPLDFADRYNDLIDLNFGFIQINLTNAVKMGFATTPVLWSRPIPLGWYFNQQWINRIGRDFSHLKCMDWKRMEDRAKRFMHEVPRCPCTLEQAKADKGRFAPDPNCDMLGSRDCYYTQNAVHCVRSGVATMDGTGQQCCYDIQGYLLLNADALYGGMPARAHPYGLIPFTDPGKVPSLSHWALDIMPFHFCCLWSDSEGSDCYHYRWIRQSQDCVGYQQPNVSIVYGDPHIVTFDKTRYTFNGLGEYVLARTKSKAHILDVQGRFERMIDDRMKSKYNASILTAVVAADNISSVVEVQLRPLEARWRYRLNVIVDRHHIYFDRMEQKIQVFKGVTVYVPGTVLNQSHVVILFSSGAGVEVIEAGGQISGRVYLPQTFMNLTKGLFGNWTGDPIDDFTLPNGIIAARPGASPVELFTNFGSYWRVSDAEDVQQLVGRSIFFHEYDRNSATYYNATFRPDFAPVIPEESELTEGQVSRLCGLSEACRYDYIITGRREFAAVTLNSEDSVINLKSIDRVISCGVLFTPKNGRKSSVKYTVGTKVKFDCDVGYVLAGEQVRECYATGYWSWPNLGTTQCIAEADYYGRQAGMVAGVVVGALVLVICIILCVCCIYRRQKEDQDINTPTAYGSRDSKPMVLTHLTAPEHPELARSAAEDEA